jgi:hypothetical protein
MRVLDYGDWDIVEENSEEIVMHLVNCSGIFLKPWGNNKGPYLVAHTAPLTNNITAFGGAHTTLSNCFSSLRV